MYVVLVQDRALKHGIEVLRFTNISSKNNVLSYMIHFMMTILFFNILHGQVEFFQGLLIYYSISFLLVRNRV